ncbi:sulfotransferase family 2 domain-containing protein [Actibacterium pelagium]|uniref:sulfotransferase family 2 domain-containing protein n=1 Tax=Actibacterium pelagium TaxID=2029103 RepID=UPI0013040058|nr:sulfotransferase family 2 domain-containing protein [Actibacterium pelagium]
MLAPVLKRYRCRHALAKLPRPVAAVAVHAVSLPRSKAIFVKNSKAACTSLSQQIYRWEHGQAFEGVNVHRDRSLIQGIWEFPKIVEAFLDPDFVKVSTVRDPVRRCVSGFTDFVLDRKNGNLKYHRLHWEKVGMFGAESKSKKFDLFLDYVEESIGLNPELTDEHFRQQFYNLRPDHIDYDHLLRVEHLSEDLEELGRSLDLSSAQKVPGKNRSNKSRHSFLPTPEQIDRIEEIYAIDFDWLENMGYRSRKGEQL